MIFDKFCGIVERLFPELRKYAEAARIFEFPKDNPWFDPQDTENFSALYDTFFLPFPTIAVEHGKVLIILHDRAKDAVGLNHCREFLIFIRADDRERDLPRKEGFLKRVFEPFGVSAHEAYIIRIGEIQLEKRSVSNSYNATGDLFSFTVCTRDRILARVTDLEDIDRTEEAAHTAVDIALTAILKVMQFNRPDRFVLEISPVTKKKPQKTGGKIARSDDRPKYTLLTPTEIRVKMGLPKPSTGTGTGTPKIPHERRRHYRTYRSDYFREAKGKTIIIPATWVGPHEVIRGNKRYKVMLNI
jgi:hypothetical protein